MPVSDLRITPAGHAVLLETGESALRAVADAFARSTAEGLLHLAGAGLRVELPAGAAFAREFSRRYITRLCQTTLDRHAAIEPPAREELAFFAMQAPPMVGSEYLNQDLLAQWWRELDALARDRLAKTEGGLPAFLLGLHPSWHAIGRVTFHLAENKRDPVRPFAFLATYISGVSDAGKPQHVPLSRAMQEYAGTKDRAALLKLLKPVSDAQQASEWVKELVDSGAVYRPQAWTPREAHGFLQNVPAMEASGIVVRVPDWWKARRPARPQVSVTIGAQRRNTLGIDAMLDFEVSVTLGDQSLSREEIKELLDAPEHLVQLRGQWVEIDRDKLKQALDHWKRVERQADDGVSFIDGMRLLSGMPANGAAADAQAALAPEWAGVQAGEWLASTLQSLRDPGALAPPADLKATLRPYQEKGYAWLRFLSGLGLGACLADDMGLGKTVQVIALLLHRKSVAPTPASLLVVPASLIPNWKSELARFAPSLRAMTAHPSETNINDPALAQQFDRHDLVITTYTMLTRLEPLRKHKWQLAILDEAQAIKNAGARQSKTVKELDCAARIALSGTPIENRLSDLWSLFDFLNPGLLGSSKSFGDYAKQVVKSEKPDGYAPLRRLIQPYILRRLKTDKTVINDLPDKTEIKAYCTLSKEQAKLYQQSVEQLSREIEAVSEGIQRNGLVLSYLMRFKQICNHPSQCMGDGIFDPKQSGKFARLAEICAELAERQQRALIFTQFREMTDPIAAYLKTVFGTSGLVLHGSTGMKQRKEMVEQFQRDDGPPFFVLSIKAGGTGLNLTAAANVIHFDRWWNPAVENQATDRAFRIGQKQNVLVHKFICRGTVEEQIDAMIEEKIGLSRELLGESGAAKMLTDMSDAELLKFVSLDLNRATGE